MIEIPDLHLRSFHIDHFYLQPNIVKRCSREVCSQRLNLSTFQAHMEGQGVYRTVIPPNTSPLNPRFFWQLLTWQNHSSVCLTLTCFLEAHCAHCGTLILLWNDEQTVIHFRLFEINSWQLQREVPSLCSISWEFFTFSAQFLHISAIFKHWSEHHFTISSPLNGKIHKA